MSIRLVEPTTIKDEKTRTYINQLLKDLRNALNDLENKDKTLDADITAIETTLENSEILNYIAVSADTPTTAPTASGTNSMAIGNLAVVENGSNSLTIGAGYTTGEYNINIGNEGTSTTDGIGGDYNIGIGGMVISNTGTVGNVGIGSLDDFGSIDENCSGCFHIGTGILGGDSSSTYVFGDGNNIQGGSDDIVLGNVNFLGDSTTGSNGNNQILGYGCSIDGEAFFSTAIGFGSSVLDLGWHATAIHGGEASLPSSLNMGLSDGNGQISIVGLSETTTNATPVAIKAGHNFFGEALIPQQNHYWFFKATITAVKRVTGNVEKTNESAQWEFSGVVRRIPSASYVIELLVPTSSNTYKQDPTWDVSMSVDTSTQELKFTVTGAASKTIDWIGKLEIIEHWN